MPHTSIIDQQGDAALPQLARFADLKAAGIVNNHTQLGRMIKEQGFPEGVLLSPNVRAWDVRVIREWLATRPTATAPLKGAAKAKRAAKRKAV
jgi:hypothetical protein